jgi:GNAT superfamily N-acetyltransferase
VPPRGPIAFRPARDSDLDACTRVWKAGIDEYQGRLNQPPTPDDLAPLRRLLAHLLITDPDRFWVAAAGADDAPGGDADRILGFAAASVRDDLWFLAMLFVEPAAQAGGLGQALMDRAQAGRDAVPGGPAVPGPDAPLDTGIGRWGMCTDSVQPISNALYARRGMVPRIPIWRLFGEVRRWGAVPVLPRHLESVPFDVIAGDGPDGHRRLAGLVDGLDREIIGLAHGRDHAYLRREGRAGFLLRERGGRPLGYAYGSGVGRMGPVAAVDPELHPALIGVALRETPVPGPMALWVPGTADILTRALLDAGLRFDGFPGLICWSTSDHPFERYVPISLAMV